MKTLKEVIQLVLILSMFLVFLSPIIVGPANMHFGKTVREEIQITGWKTCCHDSVGLGERYSTLIIAERKPELPTGNIRGAMNLPPAATIHEFYIQGDYPPIKVGQQVTISLTCISHRVLPALHFMDEQICRVKSIEKVIEA